MSLTQTRPIVQRRAHALTVRRSVFGVRRSCCPIDHSRSAGGGLAYGALLLAGALAVLSWTGGCATGKAAARADPVPRAARADLRERWGIEVTSLHLSAHGRMVDFRYRVLDPAKAALLGDRNVKPTLTDLATGAVLRVPSFPKTGSMRQTGAKLQAGRIYFMLFANTGMPVKAGSRVTVTVGDFKAEGLIVQ